jgi:5'-3' exoribonuclease 2
MWKLKKALEFYITERLNRNPLWEGLKVIFSDASIPGEGEHKMLDFIRS